MTLHALLPFLTPDVGFRVLASGVLAASAALGSRALRRCYAASPADARDAAAATATSVAGRAHRRRSYVTARNALWLVATVLIAALWLAQLRHVAFSVAAVTTGLLIAGRELVMSVLGRLVFATARPCAIGDVIEIGAIAGQVIDVNVLTTTVLEIDAARQYTGHTLEFPNSMLLTAPLRNLSHTGAFVLESLRLPVAADCDVREARERLLRCVVERCSEFLPDACRHLADVESTEVLHLPDFQPRVLIEPRDAYQLDLVARFPVPSPSRAFVAQEILQAYYGGAVERARRLAARRDGAQPGLPTPSALARSNTA